MLFLVGQFGGAMAEREAFQEIDYRRMYGPMAKWVAQIDRIDRLPEFLSRALHTAVAGRPGPVVLVLPEDVLFDQASVEGIARQLGINAHPGPQAVDELVDLLGVGEPSARGGRGHRMDHARAASCRPGRMPTRCPFARRSVVRT